MENISIKKVETKREMDDFVKFTNWLYADCPYYVPDLEMDIRNTFNPRKNAGLEYSVLQPFIAYNEAGKPVGRIAGIINHRANQKECNQILNFSKHIDTKQICHHNDYRHDNGIADAWNRQMKRLRHGIGKNRCFNTTR